MEAFPGSILLVSHDRYLVDRLATQIWEVRDGRLEVFRGTYAEKLEAGGRKLEGGRGKQAAGNWTLEVGR